MLQFAHPWAFLLLLPWALVAWRMLRRAHTQGILFASASNRFAQARPSWRHVLTLLAPILFLCGLLALVVAAANPRTHLSNEVRTADALAVIMTVDISASMLETDLAETKLEETRLDIVKALFQDFVRGRPDDLIGLVTFGGYASVRAPLTTDHDALLHLFKGVEIPSRHVAFGDELNTAIGDGLAVSLLRLKDAEPTSKIVILLSDGAQNTGVVTPDEAATAAREYGIRVYTIGVGRDARTFDEAALKSIADKTGGRYAHARSADELANFLKTISELETTTIERQVYTRYTSKARPWIMGGSLLCAVSVLLMIGLLRRPL